MRPIHRMGQRALLFAGLVVATASAPLASAIAQSEKPLTKVTVGQATVSTPPYTAYTTSVPQELFFKEEGLQVTTIGLGGATVAVQALDAGRVDIALPANAGPLALLAKYPNAGIVSYFTFINGFQSMPAVLDTSPIKDLKGLAGKTIGVQSLGNSQVQTTKALVQIAGGDPASLTFVAVGEGMEAAHALETARVDALALFDGLYGQIEDAGFKLRHLSSESTNHDAVGFTGSAITKAAFFKDHRDTLVRFGRALAKAMVFCKENPEAAVRIHWKYFPETRRRDLSEEEALRNGLASLKARLANVYAVDGLYGNSTKRQIDGFINLMTIGGLLPKGFQINSFWDPSLLKEINDFDRDAVRRMARAWKPS